ncbi:MAG: FkbM family methyltransferase [Blastocatellia bacterium]
MDQLVRKNGLEFNVVADQHADFWRKLETNVWEPQTFAIFDHFLSPDCIYVDIGAWVGPTLLYAAQRSKAAYAFEPDPVAFAELSRNVESNAQAAWRGRVRIYQQAVDHQAGTLKLGSRGGGGDSMTSALLSNEAASWEVEKVSLPDFFAQHGLQSGKVFVKMDIEGGEYQLLPHLRNLLSQTDLVLYLSIHPWILAQSLRERRWFVGKSLPAKLRRRQLLVAHHLRLLRALPFRYLYHEDGRPITRTTETLRALASGDFITTLVGAHQPWESFCE